MQETTKSSTFKDVFKILKMVKGFKKMLAVSIVVRLAEKLGKVTIAYILAYVISIFLDGNVCSLSGWVIAILLLILVKVVISYLDTYISHNVSFKIVKELQEKVYKHIDYIAPGGLKGINSADSTTLIISDISVFEWFVAHCLVEWIGTLLLLITVFIYMCQYSVVSALVEVAVLIIMFIIPFIFSREAGKKGFLMKKAFGELNGIVTDGVLGNKDIVSFHWRQSFFDKLQKKSNMFSKLQSKYAFRSEWERTIEALLSVVVVLAGIMFLPSINIFEGFSIILPVFSISMALVLCVNETLSESTNYGFVFGAAKRIMSILKLNPTVQDTGRKSLSDIPIDIDGWNLDIKNIKFRYDESGMVIDDLSLSVKDSSITAIVASSGEGKSTLSKLLQRFWDPKSGDIYVNSISIKDLSLYALREIIMVVPQETYLFHDTIMNNILLAKPDAPLTMVKKAVSNARADGFISKLADGLETVIGENGVCLSGGERQRIALAQAFLKNPPILILDEATSALDVENEIMIMENIRKERKGKITILISHRRSSIQMSDEIVYIKSGKVYGMGKYDDLIQDCKEFETLVEGELGEK